jgi:hypothetical protein
MPIVPTCRAAGWKANAVTAVLGKHPPILVCQSHADAFADRVPYEFSADRTGLTFSARH